MKIVLFGDSLLKNFGKDQLLELETAVAGADIYNCAVGGWDTNDGVKKSPYIAGLKSDVVILGFGTNDCAPWKQVPLEQFRTNIKQLLQHFAGSRVLYFLPPPIRQANGHGADYQRSPEMVKRYHDAAKELLAQEGIEYLDSHAIFTPLLESNQNYHIEDGIHLNDLGYKILIKELSKLINSIASTA